MKSERPKFGRSVLNDVGFAAALSGAMHLFGDEPSVMNTAFRIAIWGTFLLRVVRPAFLWQPGPSSWFVLGHFLSYGSWPLFYLTGILFFADTASFVTVAGKWPTEGFLIDRGCFLFMVVAWSVVRFLGPPQLFYEQPSQSRAISGSLRQRQIRTFQAIVAGTFGAVAALVAPYAPAGLIQPLHLFAFLFPASLAILVLSSDPGEPILTRFRWPIMLAGAYGIVVFSGSGAKGAVFITLFHLAWFVGSCNKPLRPTIVLSAASLFIAFIVLLPAFQAAKETFTKTESRSATIDALKKGVREGLSDRKNYLNFRGKNFGEAIWEYLGFRMCAAGVTRKYYEVYADHPYGYETVRVAVRSTIPRIIDPNKISTDQYYNELAILTGIGGRYDFKTSRKPTFQEESVLIWGKNGFFFGGLAFGVYLTILERLAFFAARNATSLAVLRYAWVPLGLIPYIAAIFGGYTYASIFCLLTIVLFCHAIWPQREKTSGQSSDGIESGQRRGKLLIPSNV